MTAGDDEARLRAAMVEAHRVDARVTPPFARLWRGQRAARHALRWTILSAGLAAALALVVWQSPPSSPPPAPFPLGTRWIAPTDFLLQTPDLITLRTLPVLERADDTLLRPPTDSPRELR